MRASLSPQLSIYIDYHVMFLDRMAIMKPWLLAFILDSPRPATPFNQDNLLKRYAEDSGIRTQGLMSAIDQLNTFTVVLRLMAAWKALKLRCCEPQSGVSTPQCASLELRV